MFTINRYVPAESLEQAYEQNQDKSSAILGGIMWLKMSSREIETAIDLSALGLNQIEETADYFRIGAMCTLRNLELHPGLNSYFQGYLSRAVEHIVGVQFRNGATVGGTVASRFPFSDLLTALLALPVEVELFRGGKVSLQDYAERLPDKDIVVSIFIKKDSRRAVYMAERKSATDFPILTCAVSRRDADRQPLTEKWSLALGARPQRAKAYEFTLAAGAGKTELGRQVSNAIESMEFGSNFRGSKEYRRRLAAVLTRRCIEELLPGSGTDRREL